uniref:Uncharacterized protein n=1 Tax=Nelumbo nucifera TaxID=4432 RepID=A0A822Y3F6_NELNU|nr:TPA_asm: hypothetical protein HUJ06_028588 [Nelumbo nucifera]
MEANAGMVAGSHKRNEFVMIRKEGEAGVCFFSRPIFSLNSRSPFPRFFPLCFSFST